MTLVVTVVVVVVIDISPLPPNFRPSASMTVSAVVITGHGSNCFGVAVMNSTVFGGKLGLRDVLLVFIGMNLQSLVGWNGYRFESWI